MVMYNNTVDEDSPTYGAIASLSCDDGFFLDGGAHVVYCQHDGSWSSTTVPECMGKLLLLKVYLVAEIFTINI